MLGRTPKDAMVRVITKKIMKNIRQQFNHQNERSRLGLSTYIQTKRCFGQSNHNRYTCTVQTQQSDKVSCLSNVLRNMCNLARVMPHEKDLNRNESRQARSRLMKKCRKNRKAWCRHQASGLRWAPGRGPVALRV